MAHPTPASYRSIARHLESIDVHPLSKEGTLYTAHLQEPLILQTPPVQLLDPLVSQIDGQAALFARIRLTPNLTTFFQTIETTVQNACLKHHTEWFGENISAEGLRGQFKSFLMDENHALKMSVQHVACFNEKGEPMEAEDIMGTQNVRLILEMHRCVFGRHSWGASWRATQLQVCPPTPLLRIQSTIIEGEEDEQEEEEKEEKKNDQEKNAMTQHKEEEEVEVKRHEEQEKEREEKKDLQKAVMSNSAIMDPDELEFS
jgi:hypothetical protein